MREVPQNEVEEQRPPVVARRAKLLRLAAQGVNARRAASLLGLTYGVVLQEYRDPGFRRQVLSLVEGAFEDVDNAVVENTLSLHEKLRMKSEDAFNTLCDILDDDTTIPALRVKIAQDFLDRNPEVQAGSTIRRGDLETTDLVTAARAAREIDNVLPITAGCDPTAVRTPSEEKVG